MVDLRDQFEYVGFWRRSAAVLLDLLFYSPALFVYFYFEILAFAFRSQSVWPFLLHGSTYYLLSAYCIVRFGGTPGKLILGMKVVAANGGYLSLAGALRPDSLGYVYFFVSAVLVWNAIVSLPGPLVPGTSAQAIEAMDRYGGWLNRVDTFLLILSFVDLLAVAFNRRKRALHDFIARSYVITKRSCDAIHTPTPAPSTTPANGLSDAEPA